MTEFHLPATDLTPEVRLDPELGVLSLRGESYPEHVLSFYAPILDKIGSVLESGQLSLDFQEVSVTER